MLTDCNFFYNVVVDLLANLFIEGEDTFSIHDERTVTDVKVTRKQFCLSEDAEEQFTKIHDDWEINMCKKYRFDKLISGEYVMTHNVILRNIFIS